MLARKLLSPDRYPCGPVTLFDFSNESDALDGLNITSKASDGWRVSDDSVIGGFSTSTANLFRTRSDFERYLGYEEKDNADIERPEEKDEVSPPFTPFLRWEGTIDTTVGLASDVRRSGFAALRSPEFPFGGANLQGLYEALEIVCRTDSRLYKINLHVASFIPGDIFQGQMQVTNEEGGFNTIVLPFSALSVTSKGREREIQRELDDNIQIESIGFALMDGQDGYYQFDLARIRCVNMYEGKVFEGLEQTDSN